MEQIESDIRNACNVDVLIHHFDIVKQVDNIPEKC